MCFKAYVIDIMDNMWLWRSHIDLGLKEFVIGSTNPWSPMALCKATEFTEETPILQVFLHKTLDFA